jgi:two-component system, LytTR family, sensor kinase
MSSPVKSRFDIKKVRLYAWVGLAMFCLSTITEATQGGHKFSASFLNNLWLTVYIMVINYFFFEYVLARLGWKHFFRSFLWLLLVLFCYSAGMMLWAQIGYAIHMNTFFVTTHNKCSDVIGYSFFSFVIFGISRHVYNHVRLKETAQKLRIEKQEAELNYLKSQTNPHFLFNTLNNIYSLSRDKSDLAPESILRLSKILRYMLYEAGGPYIAIEQELKIIGDYISLERLRYDESLNVNFNYDVEDMRQSLPPLLLIPFVENAFKHGVSETRNNPFINIHLSIAKRQLTFLVINSTGESVDNGNTKENIGLSNLRRQLELLYKDYQIFVEQRPSEFVATLKINLASHV